MGVCMGVYGGRFSDNTPILDEPFDVVSRVGIANLCLLCGVEPDLRLIK